jgi:multicomponent Na+:H+ antiporter subunit A
MALSLVGFSLAVIFALLGAPDVAIVAVLVETMFTLLFLGTLALFPKEHLACTTERARAPQKLNFALSLLGGAVAFAIAWQALGQPAQRNLARTYVELTPRAHAKDVVTAILADFRGLDTMGEITVIAIALATVMALMRGQEFRR